MFSKLWQKLRGKPRAFVDMTERERYLKAKKIFLQIIEMGSPMGAEHGPMLFESRRLLTAGLSADKAAAMDVETKKQYAESLKTASDLVELEIKTRVLLFTRDADGYTFDKDLLEAVFALLHSDVFQDLPLLYNSSGQQVRNQDWIRIFMRASDELETLDPRLAKNLNKMMEGMNNDEMAKALGIPLARVEGEWRAAKAWLRLQLG
jgi:hypothetical protein